MSFASKLHQALDVSMPHLWNTPLEGIKKWVTKRYHARNPADDKPYRDFSIPYLWDLPLEEVQKWVTNLKVRLSPGSYSLIVISYNDSILKEGLRLRLSIDRSGVVSLHTEETDFPLFTISRDFKVLFLGRPFELDSFLATIPSFMRSKGKRCIMFPVLAVLAFV